MRVRFLSTIAGIVLLASIAVSWAAVPELISFQALLTDGAGTPVPDDIYIITFEMYNDSTGGDLLWSEAQELVVSDGLFNARLGAIEPLKLDAFTKYADIFVSMRIKGGPEFLPRTRLTSAAFSLRAWNADAAEVAASVTANSITSAMIKNGTIQLVDLAPNAADSGQVIKWNGSTWAVDQDQAGGGGGGGWVDDGTYVRLETSTDYVGIGTNTPTQKLHLYGSGAAGIDLENGLAAEKWRLIVPAGGNLRFHEIPNAVDVLNLTSTGRVGIGTGSPLATLHVNETGSDDLLHLSVSTASKFMVKNNGKVGIGVTTPDAKLDVNGVIRVTGTSALTTGKGLELAYNSSLNLGYVRAYDRDGGTSGDLYMGDGSVGIGIALPEAKLHVSGGPGAVNVLIDADRDNAGGETDHPTLTFAQDGGSVIGELGYFNGLNDLTLINRYPSGGMVLGTGNNTAVTIQSDGDVGIGTTNPGSHQLHVKSVGSGVAGATAFIENTHASGLGAVIENNSTDLTLLLSQRGSGDVLRCDSWTGGWHPVFRVGNDGYTVCSVLELTGGSDLAEPFTVNGDEHVTPGMVVCIDPDNPGQLCIARHAYDRTVAGIISGANGLNPGLTMKQIGSEADGAHPIALTGRVYCWVDAGYGAIQPGDFLTTSDTPGHAMKAADPDNAYGAVIGKAMASLDEGRGLVLVLVNLQ